MIKKGIFYLYLFTILVLIVNINTTAVDAAEVWLPESPYWLDSIKNKIPKENTFSPMWSSKSKIIAHSDGILVDKEGQGKHSPIDGYIPFTTKKAEWLTVSNVGYYNNTNINMKITIKTVKPAQDETGKSIDDQLVNTVSIKDNLSTVYAHESTESMTLTYEFIDDQDKPVSVSGYWAFRNMIIGSKFDINKNWVKKIYSVSRSYVEDKEVRPVVIKIGEDSENIFLHGTEERNNLVGNRDSSQSQAVITYDNRNKLEFVVSRTPDSPYINFGYGFSNNIIPQIEIPAPSGKEQIIKSISKDSTITQEFIQYLPFQSIRNRTKDISWEVSAQAVDSLIMGDWKITNEAGTDSTALFSITNANGKTTIQPKDKTQEALYGHYFYFERKVGFTKIPIDEKLLRDQDGGKYLDTTGTVTLNVSGDPSLKTTFKTTINFLSKVNYHYLDQDTTKPILPLPDTIKTEMSGLITHSYPLLKGEIVPEYGYLSVTPTNIADQLIQYTQEDVSFLYGKFTIKSKKISVPLGMDTTKFTQNQLKSTIESIKLGGNELTDYEISSIKAADTSVITTDVTTSKMTLKIKANVEGKLLETHIDILVDVTWGNSIALGGSGTIVDQATGESTFALTLHEDSNQQPYITGSYGNISVDKKTSLDKNNLGEVPYYQITYLDMSKKASGVEEATEVSTKPLAATDVFLNAANQSTPVEMLEQFKQKVTSLNGTDNQLSVHYDDVIGVYTTPVGQQAIYKSDQGPLQPLKDLPNQQTVFYKITKSGFVPLYLDHLASKAVSIASKETESKASYDTHYAKAGMEQYFSIPSTNSEYKKLIGQGFKTYPKLNLAVTEESKGTVYVAEQISETNDNYLKCAYELTFTGSGPEIQFEKPEALTFGTPEIKGRPQKIHQTNVDWQLSIGDNRLNKTPWEIGARVTQSFQSKVGGRTEELKGAILQLKGSDKTISLNQKMQKIYAKDKPEMSNVIQWKDSNGFYLSVPPGIIKKNLSYQTEIEFLLSVGP